MITSKENEKIKYINSLKNKKFRDKYNKYILEGIKLVDEHISSAGVSTPEFIVLSKSLLLNNSGGEKLYEKLKNTFENNLLEVDENVFNHLTETTTPQGVLAVLDKKKALMSELLKAISNKEKIVILDKVSDAGNMGTIIRTAVSFGIKNLICIKGTVDVYMSKVVRSAMGAINKLNIYYIDENELELLKKPLNSNRYKLVATDLKAKKYLHECNVSNNFVYVLGNESQGVSKNVKNMCDELVKIDMEDVQESLNVGIAAAILMYDMYIRGDIGASQING